MKNKDVIGKYFIIQDLQFNDFMKNKDGVVNLYNTIEEACETCGMYEFENALVCKVEFNYIEK